MIAWSFCFLVAPEADPAAASPESLARLLLQEADPPGIVSAIHFVPLDQPASAISRNADLSLPPASVQKIITSVAALDLLGPDHTFESRLVATGPIEDGVLRGDLILCGDGDPFLVSERVWILAHDAAAWGLREITGRILVETSLDAGLDSIRAIEDRESPYSSPVTTLGVNFNSVAVLVRPGAKEGDPAICAFDPCPIPGFDIISETLTVRPGQAKTLDARRFSLGTGETWKVTGSIALGAEPERLYRATLRPGLSAAGLLGCLLAREGVRLTGATGIASEPSIGRVIARLSSYPLGELIRRMNGYSNNYMADRLLLALGADTSSAAGARKVLAWSAGLGLTGPPLQVFDGSGLDPRDRATPRQITSILAWSEKSERIFADLFASFARPGGAGTMERRFRGIEPPPSMRAKTGTLGDSGVSSIAGYIDAPGGGRYAFCILQQARPGDGLKVADLRAREERWLTEFSRP